jgi:hypothetical protein
MPLLTGDSLSDGNSTSQDNPGLPAIFLTHEVMGEDALHATGGMDFVIHIHTVIRSIIRQDGLCSSGLYNTHRLIMQQYNCQY